MSQQAKNKNAVHVVLADLCIQLDLDEKTGDDFAIFFALMNEAAKAKGEEMELEN